jgi:two-component system response regulator HydG
MKSLKIFIVDDDQDFAKSLAEFLKDEGHQVDLAFNGESAIQKYQENEFDITFMDVKLPGMNGVESFFQIRKINPHARVVMMTAFSVEQLLNQAIEKGALGVLRKPFGIPRLMSLLEDIQPDGVILIVDDDHDFIDGLKDWLIDHGYRVVVAYTGQEAVDLVLNNGIDILVLDLKLPVLSGLEVYLTLKKQGCTLPTIIVTGYEKEEAATIDKLHSMSIAGCLIKPFKPEDLLEIIRVVEDEKIQKIWFPSRLTGE